MDIDADEVMQFFGALHRFGVQYLVVGGFAVNRYGYKRTTGDIDIYLKDSAANRRKLIDALDSLGYGRFEELMTAPIMAGYCEVMLDNGIYADLMTEIPGLHQEHFDDYLAKATIDSIGEYVIYYINYHHLIQNKAATGRTKDKQDIAALRDIQDENSFD